MGKINSRQKGKRGELELAHLLSAYGYEARRSQQYAGINNDADVVGLPDLHIECKRVQNLNLDKAMEQAYRDAKDTEMPVVMHRKDRSDWKVTMKLDHFMLLYRAYQEKIKSRESEEQNQ